MNGELIGVNTSPLSKGGGSEGVGFAIPSNMAKTVKDRLLGSACVYACATTGANPGANMPASRGYLGVSVLDQQATWGGVVVAELTDGSPASAAGLRGGDVNVEFDGKPVRSSRQLAEIIASTPVGRPVNLKFVRNGQEQTASIMMAAPACIVIVSLIEPTSSAMLATAASLTAMVKSPCRVCLKPVFSATIE
jgi:serine protease Do